MSIMVREFIFSEEANPGKETSSEELVGVDGSCVISE
jgi:hypothetical protein